MAEPTDRIWWWVLIASWIVIIAVASYAVVSRDDYPEPPEMQSEKDLLQALGSDPTSGLYAHTTSLLAIEGKSGEGIATRQFNGEEFTHTISAVLADPGDKWYQGWLETAGDDPQRIKTGRLEGREDGAYALNFQSGDDKRSNGRIVVSVEEVDDDTVEDIVLEGKFD